MTETRGWCPSLFEPMASGDGLLVRVKPRLGVLTAAAARVLAEAAAAHGIGAIELTGRANLQCRGFSEGSAAAFADCMVAAGLANADRGAERRRTVIATPLAGPATACIVAALEAALEADDTLAGLPAKFGFAVDGGGALGLGAVSADVVIRVGCDRCEVLIGDAAALVSLDDAVPAAMRLAHAFLGLAGEERRMRALEAAPVFAAAGLKACSPALPSTSNSPIGRLEGGAFGAGLVFGDATALPALADLADRFGDCALRLTPWRAVVLAGVSRPDALRDRLASLGLIVDPGDPRLRVSACPGQPACASATVGTRALAAALRPVPGETIHVSGCSKGCAHPGPAARTLVGRDGAFDLVRHGRAADPPVRLGLTEAEALAL